MGQEGCRRLRCARRGPRASFLSGSGTGTRRQQINNLRQSKTTEESVARNQIHTSLLRAFVLLAALVASRPAVAQDAKQSYAAMAPLDQYLMERTAEITLARTAAPESISRDAEVMALGRHGFEIAVKGKNGFACIVERSWTSAPDTDFWNAKVRTPICYNQAAAHSVLPRDKEAACV